MTWKEYLPLAEKTLSLQFNSDEKIEKILHAIIGTLTEVEEILENYNNDGELITDIDKQGSLSEEVCDIYWYLSILFRELNISTVDISTLNKNELENKPFITLMNLTKKSLKFLDLLKKKLYYNKNIENETMIGLTIELFSILNSFCSHYSIDINNSLAKNIEKLKARYSEKFTSERAINRDLETERKILEGGK